MSKPIWLKAAAQRDLVEAVEWYDRQVPGLGDSFLSRLQQTFDSLSHHPEMFPIVVADARRALVRQFPYAVIYRIEAGAIRVLGIMPTQADPQGLLARMPLLRAARIGE